MLLRYGARNFCCFREGVEISLELGNNCPENISRGKQLSNLLCVKGANGSGKTNILKILGFLQNFCCNSFSEKPDKLIYIDSFFMNEDPIDLFCDFSYDNIKYNYELSLKRSGILYEKLSRKVNRLSPIFERKKNKLNYCINEFSNLKHIKLRSNASIISSAHQYEIENIHPIYNFFESIRSNVHWFGRHEFIQKYDWISEYYHNNPKVFKRAKEIIKEFDLGISNIKIREIYDEEEKKNNYFPVFRHDVKVDNPNLIYHQESLGTQTLFRSMPYYLYSLNYGGILVMDEFDTDFHPHMLKKIVSWFDDASLNVKNAQMLFSTHNTDILEYMSKYRTVFVNKESSQSYAYRLDEIPGDIIRNDRPIVPVYNSGKIGGVPNI